MAENLPIKHATVHLVVMTQDSHDVLTLDEAKIDTTPGYTNGLEFSEDRHPGWTPAIRRVVTAIELVTPLMEPAIEPAILRQMERARSPQIEATCPSCGRRLVRVATSWAQNSRDGLTARLVCDRRVLPDCARVFDVTIPIEQLRSFQ